MADTVTIKEVGPRDGLQSQPVHLAVDARLELVTALIDARLPEIEVGSFVSPKAVPQMADTDTLVAALPQGGCKYSVLVPNQKGYELALSAGIKEMGLVVSATELMNQNNIGKGLEDTFSSAEIILERAIEDAVDIHVYLAVAFECPYEGSVAPATVIDQVNRLMRWQPSRLMVADTIGAANPRAVGSLLSELVLQHGSEVLGCHFHDTRAMAMTNVFAALERDIRLFDSAIGGLGGCPFAPGAKGNLATEDLVTLLESVGVKTGVSLEHLLAAVATANRLLGADNFGRSYSWASRSWPQLGQSLD
jgi:hydroxymethylglutaryl-CoA lyase